MLRFVNIETEKFYFIERGWDEVIDRGGLRNCLPNDEWDNIWEEKAAKETMLAFIVPNFSKHNLIHALIAVKLFDRYDKLCHSRTVSTTG